VDFCLFRSSIFPESFLDSNSMDVDRHIGRIVPVPAAPPAIPISKLEKEREEKDREKEREKDGGRERERDGSNNRSPGNSLKVEDDGKHCGSIHSDSFPSFLASFSTSSLLVSSLLFFSIFFVVLFSVPSHYFLNFLQFSFFIFSVFLQRQIFMLRARPASSPRVTLDLLPTLWGWMKRRKRGGGRGTL
jgi:hypothetical protein